MKYLHTMVRVASLEAALDFYCDKLGLVVRRRTENEKGRFTLVFLGASEDSDDGPMVELTHNWDGEPPAVAGGPPGTLTGGRNFGHLAYRVPNIYETCQRLQDKGVTILRPPRDGRMAFIRSPDGISIELLQEGAALAPAEPWASMASTGTW